MHFYQMRISSRINGRHMNAEAINFWLLTSYQISPKFPISFLFEHIIIIIQTAFGWNRNINSISNICWRSIVIVTTPNLNRRTKKQIHDLHQSISKIYMKRKISSNVMLSHFFMKLIKIFPRFVI